MWKHPPREKIYEALSAVADGRVSITGPHEAEVVSSSRTATYHIRWNDGFTRITSDDNASRWQGYLGYPILATLMVLGRLQYNPSTARLLAGIHWKEINRRFKNDYAKAVDHVLASFQERGICAEEIEREVDSLWRQITPLNLGKLSTKKT